MRTNRRQFPIRPLRNFCSPYRTAGRNLKLHIENVLTNLKNHLTKLYENDQNVVIRNGLRTNLCKNITESFKKKKKYYRWRNVVAS